jgi:formylglycine-generating enzyme required for sulfatase activity
VSWEDCQRFLEKINARVPEIDLCLPTEAQWEYACRAGSDSATYAGPVELLGDANAPALDPIAWYGGNSGVGFELEKGQNASAWLADRQYPNDPSGTHPVRQKKPNAWQLYDMLGNVWEWCSDGQRTYTKESVVDPEGPTETGAERVLRGGSWNNNARNVRCACRNQKPSDNRNENIGFRPARAHERTGWSGTEQTVVPARPSAAAKQNGPRCVGSRGWIPREDSSVGRFVFRITPSDLSNDHLAFGGAA